jgi:hypothetical protein
MFQWAGIFHILFVPGEKDKETGHPGGQADAEHHKMCRADQARNISDGL